MARIVVYVQAGWDEAEELAVEVAQLMASKGKGLREGCHEPIRALVALEANEELNSPDIDPESWLNELGESARLVIVPQIET